MRLVEQRTVKETSMLEPPHAWQRAIRVGISRNFSGIRAERLFEPMVEP